MRVSVVIPALNEAGNIGRLVEETYRVVPPALLGEVIVVDDASTDATPDEIKALITSGRLASCATCGMMSRSGQSTAMRSGITCRALSGDRHHGWRWPERSRGYPPTDRAPGGAGSAGPGAGRWRADQPQGYRLQAVRIESRELDPRYDTQGRLSGYRLRHQGVLARGVPAAAVLHQYAPISAGAVLDLRPRGCLCAGQRPAARRPGDRNTTTSAGR